MPSPFIQKEFTTPPPLPNSTAASDPNPNPSSQNQWTPIAPGIWEQLLNGSNEQMHKSVLQWWEPNTTTSEEPITHTFIEEVCFLQGGLEDLSLNQSWGVGAYAYRLPGMLHGPYRASQEGCLMFVKVLPGDQCGHEC